MPSKKPVAEANIALSKWRKRGYSIGLVRDPGEDSPALIADHLFVLDPYPGYSRSINRIAKEVLAFDESCNWVVAAADDMHPDASMDPDLIAKQCTEYFALNGKASLDKTTRATYGVMQPTGDRWGDHGTGHKFEKWPDQPHRCIHCGQAEKTPPHMVGAYADRVAGSAWLGREWCRTMNKGSGPFFPGFTHMFSDECLQEVAQLVGVFWQRRDLIHYHDHWGRAQAPARYGNAENMPTYIAQWNTSAHWNESKALLDRLRQSDFAECMPA